MFQRLEESPGSAVGVRISGTVAAAQYPREVIVRTSDFKTNEYADLIGTTPFKPEEENPMLGWRGASRYHSDDYRDGFALECRALKKVREEMGFTNVIVMIPFCRTRAEADRVLETMAAHGLIRGKDGLQVYVMAEIPSSVIEPERFDGLSTGTNDLTQLTLGVGRDSEQAVAPVRRARGVGQAHGADAHRHSARVRQEGRTLRPGAQRPP
jgi:pyruvate,water dikinase